MRFIAMTGTQHFKPLPQLKTLGELGYAGFEVERADGPRHTALAKIVKDANIRLD
jgi:hypothetical protein